MRSRCLANSWTSFHRIHRLWCTTAPPLCQGGAVDEHAIAQVLTAFSSRRPLHWLYCESVKSSAHARRWPHRRAKLANKTDTAGGSNGCEEHMTKFAKRSVTFWIGLVLLVVGAFSLRCGWILDSGAAVQREGEHADGIVLTKAIERAHARAGRAATSTELQSRRIGSPSAGQTYEGDERVLGRRRGSDCASWSRCRFNTWRRIRRPTASPAESSAAFSYVFGGRRGFRRRSSESCCWCDRSSSAKRKARIWSQGTQPTRPSRPLKKRMSVSTAPDVGRALSIPRPFRTDARRDKRIHGGRQGECMEERRPDSIGSIRSSRIDERVVVS